jgi:hypothetical protein
MESFSPSSFPIPAQEEEFGPDNLPKRAVAVPGKEDSEELTAAVAALQEKVAREVWHWRTEDFSEERIRARLPASALDLADLERRGGSSESQSDDDDDDDDDREAWGASVGGFDARDALAARGKKRSIHLPVRPKLRVLFFELFCPLSRLFCSDFVIF